MNKSKLSDALRACLLSAAGLILVSTAHATVVQGPAQEYDGAANGGTGIDALTSNLVTDAGLSSTDFTPFGGASITVLNDGTLGPSAVASSGQTALDLSPWTLIVTLNTSATGSLTGYDLSGIKTFVGWNTDFASQDYTLSYSVVGPDQTTSFTSLGTYDYVATNSTDTATTTEISLTSSSGPIATGVAELKFQFNAAPGTNTGAYEEIEAFGTPTVSLNTPEPSTYVLMLGGLGMLGLIARIRRQMF
jgi:hypothetical protein